jgi:hypothetical protein
MGRCRSLHFQRLGGGQHISTHRGKIATYSPIWTRITRRQATRRFVQTTENRTASREPLTRILCDDIQAQIAQLHKSQHTSDHVPECDDGQGNPLTPSDATSSQTESHMYGNPALYHIRCESDRGRAIVDPEEDGLLPALGFYSRVPTAFDGCTLREDTYNAKDAKKNLHDTADGHHPAEDRVRPDVVKEPCLIVDHLAGHG